MMKDERNPEDQVDVPDVSSERFPLWQILVLVVIAAVVVSYGTVVIKDRLDTPSQNSVAVGFLQDMIAHHQQAVQLGAIGAETATDPTTRHFAQEALISQQYEVGYMTALLESWGYGTGDPDRDAMAWMGTPTSVEQMAGMLPASEVDDFSHLTGADANAAFLQLMSSHHRGGLHMAEYAAKHGSDDRVRSLAARIARNQRAELAEYRRAAQNLGVEL